MISGDDLKKRNKGRRKNKGRDMRRGYEMGVDMIR
jgi:hypothetical protein